MPSTSTESAGRGAQWAWAFYDWANSAFATTVIAGFFPIFFNRYWADGVAPSTQTLYLGLGGSISSLVVMLLSPWLGAVADRRGWKKRFLAATTLLGGLSTAALFFVSQGQWQWALVLFTIGSIAFFGGLCFYDALIVNVAKPEEFDRVSSLGYGLGYLGGGLLFAVNVAMALKPQWFGLADAGIATRVAFLMVAFWWLAFSLPLFFKVPERGAAAGELAPGWRELLNTLRRLREMRPVWLFLIAYWLYIDGVDTIIRMAVDFGLSLGFGQQSLIAALLLVQFIGFPAAIGFGWLASAWETKKAIYLGLAVYGAISAWGYFLTAVWQFYVMAAAIGLVQGGVQSLSRSYFARLIPAAKSGEYFGIYNMMGKFAAVLGPILVGVTAAATGSARASIVSVVVLFIAGGVLLTRVDARQAKANT